MGIRYEKAEDIKKRTEEIVRVLEWHWIDLNNVGFIRSHGSESRGTIARCHAMGKAMQIALNREGYYLIEVISKRFDKFPQEEQTKVLIHELMHIPKTFGGGFKHHNVVNDKSVEHFYDIYCKRIGLTRGASDSPENKSELKFRGQIVRVGEASGNRTGGLSRGWKWF